VFFSSVILFLYYLPLSLVLFRHLSAFSRTIVTHQDKSWIVSLFFLFFFFQAEDGIRDRNVTGVQTCALPISQRLRDLLPDPVADVTPKAPFDVAGGLVDAVVRVVPTQPRGLQGAVRFVE